MSFAFISVASDGGPHSVALVSASDNTSASFDNGLGNAVVENPLVDAVNGWDAHADHDRISVSVLKNKARPTGANASAIPYPYPYPEEQENGGAAAQHQKYPSRYPSAATPVSSASGRSRELS